MIGPDTLTRYIKQAFPDAEVAVVDKTGMMDHYALDIVSQRFEGMNRLDRQRSVYEILKEPMQDGRIHALEIQSRTPQEVNK